MSRAWDTDALVYAVKSEKGPIKIGMSRNVNVRVEALSGGPYGACNPFHTVSPPEGCSAFLIERITHRLLSDARISGEWFDTSEKQAIEALAEATRIAADSDEASARAEAFMENRIQFVADDDFLKTVDGWRREQPDIPSRSEAIRRLVYLGAEKTMK